MDTELQKVEARLARVAEEQRAQREVIKRLLRGVADAAASCGQDRNVDNLGTLCRELLSQLNRLS